LQELFAASCLSEHIRSVFLTCWACFNQLSLVTIIGEGQGARAHQDKVENCLWTEGNELKNLWAQLFDGTRRDLVKGPSGSVR